MRMTAAQAVSEICMGGYAMALGHDLESEFGGPAVVRFDGWQPPRGKCAGFFMFTDMITRGSFCGRTAQQVRDRLATMRAAFAAGQAVAS